MQIRNNCNETKCCLFSSDPNEISFRCCVLNVPSTAKIHLDSVFRGRPNAIPGDHRRPYGIPGDHHVTRIVRARRQVGNGV